MIKRLALIVPLLVGCRDSAKTTSAAQTVELAVRDHQPDPDPNTVKRVMGEQRNNQQLLQDHVKELLSEDGPEYYIHTVREIWALGEKGMQDFTGMPEHAKIAQSEEFGFRLEHDSNVRFEAQLHSLLRDAVNQPPAVRFRIGHLAWIRLKSNPVEGVSKLKTIWKNTGPPTYLSEMAKGLMDSSCGYDLYDAGVLHNNHVEFAKNWMREHPLPKD